MLEFAKEILPNFDTDISKRLKQVLGKRGIEFFNQAGVKSIEPNGPALTVRYTWKNQEHTVEADTVLIATGRAPRVEGLGLDRVGIHYSPKGIETDDNLQTNVPDIYAIGDVNGRCMLAHAASTCILSPQPYLHVPKPVWWDSPRRSASNEASPSQPKNRSFGPTARQ